MRARALLLLAGMVVAAAWIGLPPVEARPGGGQSYSGSSSGSSGSSSGSSSSSTSSSSSGSRSTSGGDWGDLGWPVWVAVIGVGLVQGVRVVRARRKGAPAGWVSRPPAPVPPGDPWAKVRAADPEFSAVLFDDFVYALYATAQRARHDAAALLALAPYLRPKVREQLQAREPSGAPVTAVTVGAARLARPVSLSPSGQEALVEIESNVSVEASDGPRARYLRERWTFSRDASTLTRPWTGVRTFGCPSCGAPFTSTADDRCGSCGQVSGNGRFDWCVTGVRVLESSPAAPALTGSVEERGTGAPTVLHPEAKALFDALCADDPGVSEETLFARLATVFTALQEGWKAQDLAPVRPYVSDAMFNYLAYWVEAYRAQRLRNEVVGARITRREVAKVVRDRRYDAVTVRVWATGGDVTWHVDSGRVVAGSRTRARPYSEYWTLIRGAAVRGAPRVDPSCPACGAPLAVTMAGQCEHCGVHVTSGEFDWVLSRIEQDDSYTG